MTTTTRERPIIFSAPMVRAILEGRKTQTRRVVKPQPFVCEPDANGNVYACWSDKPWPRVKPTMDELLLDMRHRCPYGAPGDVLWVREAWCWFPSNAPDGMGENVYYRANPNNQSNGATETMARNGVRWRSPIHMPRWASRLSLRVTDVRVQRLQEISEEDAKAEGVQPIDIAAMLHGEPVGGGAISARQCFEVVWDTINGKRAPWASNPWVWAVSFERIGDPK